MAKAAHTRSRPRAPKGEGDALRDELLDAAERQLLETGSMEAVSIRSIVKDVGVSPPALYLHFDDKDDLFLAVCERRFADFAQVLERATDGLDDPVERLRAMGQAYVRYGVEHGEHYQIMFGEAHWELHNLSLRDGPSFEEKILGDAEGDWAMDRAMTLLVNAVQEAMDAGRFRQADLMLTAMTIWSAVHGVVMLLLAHRGEAAAENMPDAQALQDNVCEVVLRGLTAE